MKHVALKPLSEQALVITGASSGIGRATALQAAARGARVLLAARDEDSLRDVRDAIRQDGGRAELVVADVADPDDVRRISDVALEQFGGFDTWVNNAGVSIYGRLEDVTDEDARRLFDVNYWGLVYGSRVAVKHLRVHGGALINLGSIASDRALALQGHYSATKHAVKAFTEALRMELAEAGAPVSVTLIKPGSIASRYPHHARNYLDEAATLPPPLYAPEVVAEAILACAETPRREVYVGGGGRVLSVLGTLLPGLTDRVMTSALFDAQHTDRHRDADREESLHATVPGTGAVRGEYDVHVSESSLYTKAVLHPRMALAGLAALGAGIAVALRLR